ncbi:hypothetical protein F5J12DRAFT_899404 [Pisolithus orientalis]|uniref:uncharacterized protein n=1 Tax=Pisolithus orientalis TaxID=936130 RepID=UPI0022245497|nr:uncharacterized protein F5J12DRAFT_899404 [Pisolithus orientalis]KAI5984116.1 hypothetical protein F5J12DRAFT_899404 [Pisolithus orientalis]
MHKLKTRWIGQEKEMPVVNSHLVMKALPEPATEPADALDGIAQGHQCNDPIVVTEADPPMEAAYDRDGLIHHPYLDAINLVVDPQLKALCRLLCQVALIQNEALAHLHNQHKGLQVDKEQFQQVVAQLDVADDFPEPYFTQVISPFRGLEVLTGIGCGHCAYATSSSKCMQVHHREHHRDTATPKDWTACKMQRFSRSGKGCVLFQVHDTAAPASPVPVDDAISHLRQQMAQASTSNMPQDECVIKIPRCDDDGLFPGLKAAVRQYFNEALNLLTITDELVLQQLNLPAPLKEGISNTPFHHHQNEDTMDTYTAPVIALLYMLGRVQQENTYSLLLPDNLIEKVTALGTAIREGVDVSASLHQVLTEVWMTKWPKTTGNPMPCPTEQMLALYTLEGDGKHKEPAAVTYYLSQAHILHLLEELMEMVENDTIDALQAGHSHATENWIYGLSPEALPGAAEDIILLFLQASMQWQVIMHTVPGGVQLGYMYTNPGQFQELARAGKLGLEAQQETNGGTANDTGTISEDTIADKVVAKLEERVLGNLEAHLMDKLVATLTPAIQTIVQDVVQAAMGSRTPDILMEHHNHTPTNAKGWDEMYLDAEGPPPVPEGGENQLKLNMKDKGG